MIVIPGSGAVCPAIVRCGFVTINDWPPKSITPPTSKTTSRGRSSSRALRNEPGPSASRVVTRRTTPSTPPFNDSGLTNTASKHKQDTPKMVLTIARRRIVVLQGLEYLIEEVTEHIS